jgi:hypothetical protein
MLCASSILITPIWAKPRAAPPPKAKATFGTLGVAAAGVTGVVPDKGGRLSGLVTIFPGVQATSPATRQKTKRKRGLKIMLFANDNDYRL